MSSQLSFLLSSRGSLDLCSAIVNQLSEDRPVRLPILAELGGGTDVFSLVMLSRQEPFCLVGFSWVAIEC